ncbi:protein turtle homolog B-like isoform X2 [Haliotis rubra]|uniref:protein turtle homolog B-like isoform X2 n=1 Tax=Haliotis rubra TaxID=36100 RepID=UPI001EE6148A|nr:protein turtle homolog B-like isoform X2 [Haliotis rubra]XP_046555517.1 protein turtle homolog B-like isoform X2 [Haliotis rubra]
MKTVCAAVLYLMAGVVSGAPSASPVLSAVSDTARFSWEIPQGGLGTGSSFYAVSPAGITVFLVTGTGTFLTFDTYRDRLVYQGNIAARNVTFTLSNIQTSDAGTYTCGNGGASTEIQNCGQKLVVLGTLSASPVLSAVSDTAKFSWEIPQGGLGTGSSFYAVSPAGVTVFLVTGSGTFVPTTNYIDRLVYEGNITTRNVTFTLSNIQTSDAGTYTCGNGGGASSVIQNCGQKLVVLGKPTTPGRPPVSTTPVYNQSVTLTCSSTATTVPADHRLTLTYTWQRDNTDITVTSPGSPYTFTVSSRDSHSYRCRARESQGLESEWSQEYNMEPQYGPYQISLTPSTSSYTVTEHQALPSITCSALCRPGCSYRWLHNGSVFSSGAVLQGQADRSKTGFYRCQPYNTHGSSDSVTVSVDVQYPADISMFTANSHSGSVTVNESDTVTFRCQIDSNPRSVIRLLNGTGELTRADNSLTAAYRLESADCRQRGNYTCTASNNVGAPVTQTVVLLVKSSPRLDDSVSQQLKFAATLGGDVTVSVSVLANPFPTFTWSRSISTSQDLTGSSSPVSDISATARLHLTNLQRQDFGDYSLSVDNGVGGSVTYTISVVAEGPPETPSQFRDLDNATTSSVWLSWLPGFNGGRPQTFLIEYRQFATRTWTVYKSYDDTDEMMVVEVTGLTPGEVYPFRLQARNDYGDSNRYVFVETTTAGGSTSPAKGRSCMYLYRSNSRCDSRNLSSYPAHWRNCSNGAVS